MCVKKPVAFSIVRPLDHSFSFNKLMLYYPIGFYYDNCGIAPEKINTRTTESSDAFTFTNKTSCCLR